MCFPLRRPSRLLELAGLFTGLHNELLIILGPHQVSLGPQLSLLLTQVGMVTAGDGTWRRPTKKTAAAPLLLSPPLLRGSERDTLLFSHRKTKKERVGSVQIELGWAEYLCFARVFDCECVFCICVSLMHEVRLWESSDLSGNFHADLRLVLLQR